MKSLRFTLRVAALIPLLCLYGCGDSGIQEVREWMQQTRQQTRVMVKPLPPPKSFQPFTYDAKGRVDPFSPDKLLVALAKTRGTGLHPDMNRRREPLEEYPLDNLQMVGTLSKPGKTYALIQAGKSIYPVEVGNYMGQNFGKVTRITDSEVQLKEIVQDASGEWVERDAKLELQETQK